MSNEQKIFPLVENCSRSDYYTDSLDTKIILSKGCVMCEESFAVRSEILAHYETSNLHIIGLTMIEVAETRIIFHEKRSTFKQDVFIVDKKAAVCLKCWMEFLKSVAKLKGLKL